MHPEDATAPSQPSPEDLGVEVGEAIRQRVQAIFSDAESHAREIEQAAEQRGRRAAALAGAAVREDAERERLRILDEAQARAAAIVNQAEEQQPRCATARRTSCRARDRKASRRPKGRRRGLAHA